MSILLVLLSWCVLLGLAHYSGYRHDFGRSLIDRCQFTLGHHAFNLCPVIHGNRKIAQVERLTPDKSIRVVYTFTLFGLSGTLETPQCPEGTWICMHTFDNRSLDPPSVIPIAGSFSPDTSVAYHPQAQAFVGPDHTLNAPLVIRLRGGFLGRQPQEALIQFFCNKHAEQPSSPSFFREKHGIHSFIWSTPHACPRVISDMESFSPLNSESDDQDSAPSEESKDEEKQDILEPGTNIPRTSRLFVILLLPGLLLTMVVVGVCLPQTNLRRCFDVYIKPICFPSCRRESGVFEWALQDLGVLEDEEDLMVNANEELEHSNEYIPLKPSPRKKPRTDYGSTRST